MHRVCVIDNSTLVNLTKLRHLRIFIHLRSLFNRIHVPARILHEFQEMLPYEPERKWVIEQVHQPNYGFMAYCTQYDTISLAILQTTEGIDPGEAEAAAQHKSLQSQFILSDDQDFVDAIHLADRHTRVLNTLHLIALLDLHGIITNPLDYLLALHSHSPFRESQLRSAYKEVVKDLGIYMPKSVLTKKTSFSALGI